MNRIIKALLILYLLGWILAPTPLQAAQSPLSRLQVILQGLNRVEEALVSMSLSIKAAEQESDADLSLDRLESLQMLGITEITTSLEALGYYQVQIQTEIQTHHKTYLVIYRIEKGPPTLIQSVNVQILGEGRDNPEIQKRIQNLAFKRGAQFKHAAYESVKQDLLSTALQEGFLDARFTKNEIRVTPTQQSADIVLILNTGSRYKIGKLKFKDPPYPADYLKQYLTGIEGRPYTTQTLIECQKIMTETELFKKIRLDPHFEEVEDQGVPLEFRLTPRARNKYTGGLGYGTDTGARGTLSWEHRRRHHPGHFIFSELKAAQRLKQANLQYSFPGENPRCDRYSFGVQATEENIWDGKYSRRAEFGVTQLKQFDHWERRLNIKNLSEIYRELPTEPKQNSNFLMPGLGLVWRSDCNFDQNTLNPYLKIALTGRAGLRAVFSRTNLIQGELRLNGLYPLNEKTRFLIRGEVGMTGAGNFDAVSYSLRYFTGGDYTIRGYGYKSLGPVEKDRLGNDIVVGGRYLVVGSVELERTVYKQFGLAAFFDAGQAMNCWNTPLARGLGVGIRYATPLGPLRLDFAKPLYQPFYQTKRRIRIHVTFGLDL